jgi:exodeoxyribonuclease VII small subunit
MASDTGDKTNKPVDFETAMRDLEAIVERLERGDLPLEQSLAEFERGILLTRTCQTALKDAEQKVEILLKRAADAGAGDPAASGAAAGERRAGAAAADIAPFIPDES